MSVSAKTGTCKYEDVNAEHASLYGLEAQGDVLAISAFSADTFDGQPRRLEDVLSWMHERLYSSAALLHCCSQQSISKPGCG